MKLSKWTMIMTLLASGYASAAITELTPQQVQQEMGSDQVVVFDVNPENIFKQNHIPKAKNVNFSNLGSLLPADKTKRIIFYCMSGMCSSSHQAAEMAAKNGHSNVARMPSGISGWIKAGLPTEKM